MQPFVNASASFSFTVEEQATNSVNFTAGLCPFSEQEGVGSSLWEHEKPTSVWGSQFTAAGLILVGINTNFKS